MVSYKVLLTDGLEENGQSLMRQSIEVDNKSGISAEDLLNIVGDYDALIVRGRTKVTAAVLMQGKSLKSSVGLGLELIISICRLRNLPVLR